jgi:hypothetical protein
MRRTMIGVLAASVLGAGGCGGSSTFANKPRPPTPVNLTVYIDNVRVSVSPNSVGAGPVVFIVTNQATRTEALTIAPNGNGQPLANTGPINPQATAQVTVDFQSPGEYTVSTGSSGQTDASLATQSKIRPASLRIGPKRHSSNNTLLQP